MKRERKYLKCSHRQLCDTLVSKMQDSHSKGIVFWDFMNLATGKTLRRLVGYKEKPSDKGLLFNWCPWCGGKLGERKKK